MSNKELILARSLLFAAAAAAVAGCHGGSMSSSALPPQISDASNSHKTRTLSTASTVPTVVQTRSGGGACTSSNVVSLGSQPAAGDLIVIYAEHNNTGDTLTAPSGFQTKDAKTGNYFQVAEFYKIASGSEGTSYAVGSTCTSHAFTWIAVDVKGENTSSPFDQHSVTVNNTTGISSFSTATLTPSHANDLPLSSIAPGSSNLTVSSISPSNWTALATAPYFTHKLYAGPATGTTSFRFSETTSTVSHYPSFATLDLINPAGAAVSAPTASPAPAATAAPTAAPAATATPASVAGAYTYHGCVVYGPNDWFTTNLITGGSSYATNSVDPNSASIISNFVTAHGGSVVLHINASSASVALSDAPVNVAQTSTPLLNVSSNYFYNTPWNDDGAKQIPWQSTFRAQGSCGSGDCHSIVLTPPTGYPAGTRPCIDYESYGGSINTTSSTFSTGSFVVHNLNEPYNSQMSSGGVTEANLPLLGTADVGEDASLPSINHIAYMVLPDSGASAKASSGYVAPATQGAHCASYCTNALPMGARLRLNPSKYTCPSASTNPQANKICVQLETYGMIVMDNGAAAGTVDVPVGPTSSGSNPWNASDISAISSTGGHGIPLQDFDVMSLGTIH